MENEIWKSVNGYEGIYEVSNLGRIKSLQRSKPGNDKYIIQEKIRPLQKHRNGYLSVILSNNKEIKRISVHRIVAIAFIVRDSESLVVNHKNSIRDDNRAENLEWITQSDNILLMTRKEGRL